MIHFGGHPRKESGSHAKVDGCSFKRCQGETMTRLCCREFFQGHLCCWSFVFDVWLADMALQRCVFHALNNALVDLDLVTSNGIVRILKFDIYRPV